MEKYRETLLVIYFSCLCYNVFLIQLYKHYYIYELFYFFIGSLLLTQDNYEKNSCKINLEPCKRPRKKRKINPDYDWCDDYWS